jgi:hypothetical protein
MINITKAQTLVGYALSYKIEQRMAELTTWHIDNIKNKQS